jgi:hypothetical protein
MTVYDLGPAQHCAASLDGHAFIYAAGGDVTIERSRIAAGDGAFAAGGDVISTSTAAWLFEVAPGAIPPRRENGLSPLLSRIVVLPEGSHMLRADRVESEAGAQTPAHRHCGPGIRRLERGLLLAEIGDRLDRIDAGQAWFETGHETVVGLNISGGINAFVRVMLLPATLAGGKSSFIPATAAEAAKPRAVSLRLFGERAI